MPWYIQIPLILLGVHLFNKLSDPWFAKRWAKKFWESLTSQERIEILLAWHGREIQFLQDQEWEDESKDDAASTHRWDRRNALAAFIPDLQSMEDADRKKVFMRLVDYTYQVGRKHGLNAESVVDEFKEIYDERKALSAFALSQAGDPTGGT